jgi:5-methylcytosine-specific restriction endonuclease McrA
MFYHIHDSIDGCIEKNDLDRLPENLKEEFLSNVLIIKSENGLVEFRCINNNSVSFLDKINLYQKKKIRSEIRREDLNILSTGTYTQDDIDQIFEIQQGACYYTGESLTKSPKNYAIDHIVPVVDCGSSWPSNLALATIDANRSKHKYSKRQFFSQLEKLNGKEWAENQRATCKKIDKLREKIDQGRRNVVVGMLKATENTIQQSFPDAFIEYGLVDDIVRLNVRGVEVHFPAGFLRLKSKCFSAQYLESVVKPFL